MAKMMQLDEFELLAARHGANVLRWPEAKQMAAHQLARTEAGKAILAREVPLDGMLDTDQAAVPDDVFVQKLLRIADTPRPSTDAPPAWMLGSAMGTRSVAGWCACLMLCAVIGFGAGSLPANTATNAQTADTAQYAAFSDDESSAEASSVESLIFGPTNVNEVIL